MDTEKQERSTIKTRLFAFTTLAMFVSGGVYVGREIYRAATDAFIAPAILSPDSDMVLTNKMKMAEMLVERTKAKSELEIIDADIAACDKAISRLAVLTKSATGSIAWSKSVNVQQTSAGAADFAKLAEQKVVLTTMLDKQRSLAEESKRNMEAGLVSKTDYAKEVQAQNQIELAILENERTSVTSNLAISQAELARRSLANADGSPATPEMLLRDDQLVRIELDTLKLEAEKRAKATERAAIADKIVKMDEIESELRARPVFRALEHPIDVAFVPYTQSEGVAKGQPVYDCIWGVFACKPVGTVAEVVPGEVIMPDPWGNQARGQYLVLGPAAARKRQIQDASCSSDRHAGCSSVCSRQERDGFEVRRKWKASSGDCARSTRSTSRRRSSSIC